MLIAYSSDRGLLHRAGTLCHDAGFSKIPSNNNNLVLYSKLAIAKKFPDDSCIVAKCDYRTERWLTTSKYISFDGQGFPMGDGRSAPSSFSLIQIDNTKGVVRVCSDSLSKLPLYYYSTETTLVISDRLSLIGQIVDTEIDEAGVMEFMRFSYFVNQRSCLKEVYRLRSGENLSFTLGMPIKRVATRVQSFWAEQSARFENHSTYLIDALTDKLIEAVSAPDGSMLMMSAGWDSRTVLAAMMAAGVKGIVAYNHGDENSRESLIVRKMCKDAGIELLQPPISSDTFRPEEIAKYERHGDNVIFPHWHQAGLMARQRGIRCVLSGVLGEVLGGHYGSPMLRKGLGKSSLVALYLMAPRMAGRLFNNSSKSGEVILDRLQQRSFKQPWYIADASWNDNFRESNQTINRDIQKELDFYRSQGVTGAEKSYECFIANHRAAQRICAQSISCKNDSVTISLPFSETELMSIAAAIPFEDKVHNRLNQRIIGKLAPRLLDYPFAATLVPAKYPMLAQEASRFVRKAVEQSLWAGHKAVPSVVPPPNLGWANFQGIDAACYHSVAESLRCDLFDREKISDFYNHSIYTSHHPKWDMLLKMKSLDNMLLGLTQKPRVVRASAGYPAEAV